MKIDDENRIELVKQFCINLQLFGNYPTFA
jgi:hypothetical protein